jgi:undecaprenyl-diphosphatase
VLGVPGEDRPGRARPAERPAAQRFALNLLVAFLPLAIIGLLFGKAIKAHLFNAPVVATAFIVGGLVILWAERREHRIRIESVDDLSLPTPQARLAQALALIPGTSRSGATIIGGLFFGLSRRAAPSFPSSWRSRR